MLWLSNKLAEFEGKSIVIFVHHPLLADDFTTNGMILDVQSSLKSRKPGTDIWLWGGSGLFHSLLGAGLVDGVDVAVIPVLLGGGIPLLPTPAPRTTLALRNQRVYEKSGIVGLEYDVVHSR